MIKCTMEGCPQGKDICCRECEELKTCIASCENTHIVENCGFSEMDTETALTLFQKAKADVIKKIADLTVAKKKIEEQEKEMRQQLTAAMENYGVKSFETPEVKFVYIEPTTKTTLDSRKLKKELPDIAAKYSKESAVSGYVKISVKNAG